MGCNGGYPASAWRFWKNHGIVSGDLYGNKKYCRPYAFPPCDHHVEGQYKPCEASKPTPKCEKSCNTESGLDYNEDKHKGEDAYSLPDDN